MNTVFYSNGEQEVDAAISQMREMGLSNLYVLADFDRTLTKHFVRGEKKPSLVSVLRREGILGDEYSQKAYALFDHYNPIEIDPNISVENKKGEMTKWWEAHMQLLVDTGLQKHHIDDAVNNGYLELREGFKEFYDFLQTHGIPLVIISANALGADSIRDFFHAEGYATDNIHILSNGFVWGSSGMPLDYNRPVVHVFNKDETVIDEFPEVSRAIAGKKNAILLGDSQGDPGMLVGREHENVIKMGFLNDKVEELRDIYRELYDVVIEGDGNLDELNKILKTIMS